MIEKLVSGFKFDIDRTEAEANVIHNEIPNCQKRKQMQDRKLNIFLQ